MIDGNTSQTGESSEAPAESKDSRARGYLRTTLKHGSIYTLGMILSRLVGFVMIPVYTRVLTPADYGILEILSLTTDILGMLAGMGIGLAVMRQYYAADDDAERHRVVSSAATLLIAVFAVVAAAGIALAGVMGPVLLGADGDPLLVRLAVVVLAFGSTIEVPMALLRAQQRSTSVVAVGLARLFFSLSLNIVLVVILRMGVAGVLISSVVSSFLVGGFLTVRLYRETGLHFDLPIVRRLVVFGAPLVIWNVASFVLHYSDRYFLRVFASLADVGLYSLGYKIAMLISLMISGPFADIWIPKALEIERKEGGTSGPILVTILSAYNLVLVTAAFCIAIFAGDLIRIATGDAFHAASSSVPLLAAAMVFFGYRSVGQIGALIRGRSDLIALGTAIAAVVVTLLNISLIPRFGVLGAASATLGAFAVEFFLMLRLSKGVHQMDIRLPRFLAPLAIASAVLVGTNLLVARDLALPASIALHVVAVGAYLGALALTGAIPPEMRAATWRAVRAPRETLRLLRGG